MDALQNPHRFMRPPPPPPPMSDPQQPPRPPPPQVPWFSGQFQYQAAQPPPHHQMPWAPHSEHQSVPPSASYHTPQHNPYPAHPQHQNPYQAYPPPPPYSHPSQAYSQPNNHQTLGNPNYAHHPGWEHPDRNIPNNNEEDWAARARAWAAAKAAMESQHHQSQFTHIGRLEEHSHAYQDQYQQVMDPRYTDTQQPSLPASSHQQFPTSLANPHWPPLNHVQESTSFNHGPSSSYVSDVSYTARDGGPAEDSNPVFPQGRIPTKSSIYQQEVPSSYSSVPGKEEFGDQSEQFHKPSPLSISSTQEGQHHVQPALSASGRPVSLEQPYFTHGNQSVESMTDPSDRPLEFAPGFNRNHDLHDPHSQVSYMRPGSAGPVGSVEPISAMPPPIHALTPPVVPGAVYPPIPPVPSGLQFDPSFAVPPVPGHSLPMFGQIPGPNFRPTIPTVSATFGLGAGTALHPSTAFPGDANGVSNVSERPKKASVPNWLREEIIKKAVIASSTQEYAEEDPDNPTEDNGVEKSLMKGGTDDGKNTNSYRSSDDEDDDEDDIAAARTVAINQEIKRVLTEVLSKVTDELFDEIATKVLSEDDLTVEVDHIAPPNHSVSPSPPAVPTPKASAKVLIPIKAKETEAEDASEKSTSSSPGDVLGLASYASDDNDDDEIRSSSKPPSKQTNASDLHSRNYNISDATMAVGDGGSQAETKLFSGGQANAERDHKITDPVDALRNTSVVDQRISDDGVDKDMGVANDSLPTVLKVASGLLEDKTNIDGGKVEAMDAFESKGAVGEKTSMKPELPHRNVLRKKSVTDDSHGRGARIKSDKKDEQSSKRSSASKDFIKETEAGKIMAGEKHSGSGGPARRHEERHVKREKTDERNGLQERVKDRGTKPGEKAKESDSVKSSNSKEYRRETERAKKLSDRDDSSRKKERAKDEKGDRSRHRDARDLSRHKRRRSSSAGSRDRNSKDGESSDEDSEDSRQRRPNSRKQSLSPSPTRSRRRQVTRSPRRKHSQRRHSPYSSLERKRG